MPSEDRTIIEPIPARQETLQLRHVFRAPRPRVFAAFTDPEIVSKWFGPRANKTQVRELDLQVGGHYRFDLHLPDGNIAELAGTYLEISPPERLVFTWSWVGGTTLDSEVTLQFATHESGTELRLTHRKLPNIEQRNHHGVGWSSSFEILEELLQGGE